MKPIVWSVGLALLLSPAGRASEPAVDEIALAERVRELDADDYFVRERANQELVKAGQAAIPPLADAAREPGLEKSARAIAILGQLALSTDVATADAAEQALDKLAETEDPRIVGRAKTALRGRLEVRREAAIARLQQLGAVVPLQEGELLSVNLSGDTWRGTDEDIQLLRWFPEMTVLVCDGMTCGDEAFAFFGPRMQLAHLRLLNSKITERGFAHLSQLKNLLYFQAENVPLTDAAMTVLAKMPQLRLLNLSKTAITDAGFAQVTVFENLDTLRVEGASITDAGMKPLGQLTSLKALELKSLPITSAGFQEVARLKNLQTVRLDSLAIDDAGLRPLAEMPSLLALELKHLPITSAGVEHIASLPQLRMLYLKYCPVDEKCLEKLGENTSLSLMYIYGTDISMEAADAFSAAHTTVRVDHRMGGFLGVIGAEGVAGCELQEVQPGMPADQAGFRVDDLITHYGGERVANFDELRALIRKMRAGESVEIRAKRDGEEFTKTVTLGEEPELGR